MQCKDFREIADSYLSDELLVETNHEVFRHMESCENCRRELSARRELRTRLCTAVIGSAQAQIDANFAANLKQNLENEVFRNNGFLSAVKNFATSQIFALTVAAALIVAVFVGYNSWKNQIKQEQIATRNTDTYKMSWVKLSAAAAEDHNHCALEKYDYWLKNDLTETEEEKIFKEKILNQIQSETPQSAKLVSIHNCSASDRSFHHVIMNVGDHIVSITQTASEITQNDGETGISNIFDLRQRDFELAGFAGYGKVFYVISDLPKTENTRIAEIFSGTLQAQNDARFKFASVNYALYTGNANF